ncbi:YnfA family protein [Asticcacaulis sp. YBE204]|uniref:YnfA family protein n=1 Tax=Asticcacaulis sp. YBE204 TaxID=1282363 RepID=UPI0003C3DB4B|nr:YnfA family protein [Asticcacaulis sp. YBE204]ESQ79637.1 membrane protein [Asticcacaulis sp. YBE204]
MKTFLIYALAALCEIGGCFSLYAVLRLHKTPLWLIPGAVCLIAFAWLLTLTDSDTAGRTYASYGAIYIAASIGWLWAVEKRAPDLWDGAGLLLCLIGAAVILWGPRSV